MTAGPSEAKMDSMSAAIEAMKKAAEKLAKIASGSANDVPPSAPEPASTPPEDAEAQRLNRDLEQRRELVDIDETTDVASLPPNVTHVRYPDGRVQRVGFSSPSHPHKRYWLLMSDHSRVSGAIRGSGRY